MTIQKPKENCDLTLQFYWDEKNRFNFFIAKNQLKLPWLMSGASQLGKGLANQTNILNEHDFEMLDHFCRGYLEERQVILKKREMEHGKTIIESIQNKDSTKH